MRRRRYECTLCDYHCSTPQGIANHANAHQPFFCECETPDVDGIGQCVLCFRAHHATLAPLYGWDAA